MLQDSRAPVWTESVGLRWLLAGCRSAKPLAALLRGAGQPAAAVLRTVDKAVVYPVAYKVLAIPRHVLPVMVSGGSLALRDLILMVREHLHWHSMLTGGGGGGAATYGIGSARGVQAPLQAGGDAEVTLKSAAVLWGAGHTCTGADSALIEGQQCGAAMCGGCQQFLSHGGEGSFLHKHSMMTEACSNALQHA